MSKKILFTSTPPAACLSGWGEDIEFIYPEKAVDHWSDEEVKSRLADVDGLFLAMTYCRKDMIDAGSKLKVIGNIGVGYDNIDWEYATEKKIAVVNAPSGTTQCTAEYTVALLLCVMRGILPYDKSVRELGYCRKLAYDSPASQVFGKTVGIIGFGRIGRLVAKMLHALGMKVVYFSPHRAPQEVEEEYEASYVEFEELLKISDVISLHLPMKSDTYHYISDKEFSMMKDGVYLINVARGPIVDEKALLRALNSGKVHAAGLDVHEYEPKVSQEMIDNPKVVLTPHIGTMVTEARVNITRETLSGMVAYLRGENAPNIVNYKQITE